jgi:hypothetical protein
MEEYNYEFILAALPAVLIIVGAAIGVGPSAPARTTPQLPAVRRIPIPSRLSTEMPASPVPRKEPLPAQPPAAKTSVAPVSREELPAVAPQRTGRGGDRAASVKAVAEREAKQAPPTPLTTEQQQMAESLLKEHGTVLNPKVAAEATRGAARVAGKGGAGADVPLLAGGGREVSVHQATSPFTAASIGSHLQAEAMQKGTTEIYLQINSGSREAFLKLLPEIRNAYRELSGIFVKIFGKEGDVWWNGLFGGPK